MWAVYPTNGCCWIFWLKWTGKYNRSSLWKELCVNSSTGWAMMRCFNQNFTEGNRHWRIQMSKNLSFWRLWYFCIIKKERVSSAPYMIWLLHWWNYLSWNKLICLSGTEDNLITHLSKVPDYVWRNWQLIITHDSCQRFESLRKKIDETQSKLDTVIHPKLWWEKAYVRWINEKDSRVRFT